MLKFMSQGQLIVISSDIASAAGRHIEILALVRMLIDGNRKSIVVSKIASHITKIIGMDDENISDLRLKARNSMDKSRIYKMTSFMKEFRYSSIPDPYYGGDEGFELVLDLLEDACEGLFQKLVKELK